MYSIQFTYKYEIHIDGFSFNFEYNKSVITTKKLNHIEKET